MSSPIVDADTTARIAALIAQPHGALWAALRTDLLGAPLLEVTRELQSAQFQAWQAGEPEDADLIATARACQAVLVQLTPPVTRGLSEVAQLIGEVSVVAGAVRWTAAAIGEQIQRVLDRRRQERDSEVQSTDLIELY